MPLRVGIDLVTVALVVDSIQAHGDHYLERVYSARELRDCSTSAGPDPERLAARFAAKEATLKVLRPGKDDGLSLKEIEVRRDPAGWVEIELAGPAAALAERAGLSGFALSLTHEGGVAGAVVVTEVNARADT